MNKNGTRTPARLPAKTPTRSRPASDHRNATPVERDAVQVFCRLRPMQSEADLSCFRLASPTTVALTAPETAINFKSGAASGGHKETQFMFKHVFDAASTQRGCFQVVAQPLVENLLRGKNGLLFTYGVTGSGKTYTMTGNSSDQGIMPRCLDVLFKTIADYQTKKYVFKPDKLNGFEILCEADAMLERQSDMLARFQRQNGGAGPPAQTPHRKHSDSGSDVASRASCDPSVLDGLDEDNMYAVFISYVEVYNNCVYDLLEEPSSAPQQPRSCSNQTPSANTMQTKIVREDSAGTMYVHGVHESEVKTVAEALEAFQRGQKRKRVGHTLLNAESSRSHSVFTIRLVQAPTDGQGEQLVQDRRAITVSQLSLVDLAGSERTSRTKNTGARLREAGNINNSLMTLRTCMEILRENQAQGVQRKVPYRDAKITHLFRSYFQGEGVVRMVVCINPRAEDYDESVQVMKFAEMTQDVQIARPTPAKQQAQAMDVGLTPGRRKANQLFRIAVANLEEMGVAEARRLPVDIGLVYSLGPTFPEHRLDSPESEQIIGQLMAYLEQRIHKRKVLLDDFEARQSNFRMTLHDMEREIITLRTENAALKAAFGQERQRTQSHENKIVVHESAIDQLNKKLKSRNDEIKNLQTQLSQKQQLLNQKELEKEKQKKRLNSKFAVEKEKIESELDAKLRQQKNEMHNQMRDKENKLQRLADIFNGESNGEQQQQQQLPQPMVERPTPRTVSELQSLYHTPGRSTTATATTAPVPAARGIAVSNIRHRRSRSTGERWLEHRAEHPVQLGTILQPYYRNRKSVTKLTNARDITQKTTKYCLVSQGADTDGEVETRLFKGNVIPTTGGGAQVVFDDVECLRQSSPVRGAAALPARKRPSHPPPSTARGQTPPTAGGSTVGGYGSQQGATTSAGGGSSAALLSAVDLASKCSIGIEGHTGNKKSKY